jgi:hypothetical protein
MKSSISRELDLALTSFGSQPGVTPDDVAHLRAAIQSNSDVVDHLNSDMANHRLEGFRVTEAGKKGGAVGSFEPVSGMMSIPASSLSVGGNDLAAAVRLQQAIVTFANTPYAPNGAGSAVPTPDMVENLESVLNGSPRLAKELTRAMSERDPADPGRYYLESFAILPENVGAGGTFDRRAHSMNIPANALISRSAASPRGYFDPNNLTFVIGHEVQHAFNHPAALRAEDALVRDAMKLGKAKSRVHDYTDVIGNYVDSCRADEAHAEIAGWNAVLSRLHRSNPYAGWKDMLKATGQLDDIVYRDPSTDEVLSRPGLRFEPNGSLAQSPENIEAMGRHYFDRPAKRYAEDGDRAMSLGRDGLGDYRTHYSRTPIRLALEVEDGARTVRGVHSIPQINMNKLGLHEDLIEEQGLNLGDRHHPRPYLDSSTEPAVLHHFDHTSEGSEHPFQYQPVAKAKGMSSPLHDELRQMLPAGTSEDRLAQIAFAAKQGGIEAGQIRTLDVQGDRLMMTGETVGTRAIVDLSSAPPPAQESNQQFQATEQAQQQAMQEQQAQAQSAQQSGPAMSMGA